MIIVNTGNGKGKTTAAIGQIIRSLGQGWRVCMIQLFKGKSFYGEQKVLKKLKDFEFYSFAPKHPYCFKSVDTSLVRSQCEDAVKQLTSLLKGKKKYNLIVLEEFNIAVRDGYIKLNVLLELLKQCDSKTNIIITGRGAKKALIQLADLVTEMKEIKHPFAKGVKSQKGIEY